MKTTPKDGEEFLLRLLPPIRRARGYHLYDERGKRYLDLSLAGGRALLGHRPERVLLEMKNLLSRGLWSDLPSVYERRLGKAFALLLPDYPIVRVFANEERLVARLAPLVTEGTKLSSPAVIGDPVSLDLRPTASADFPISRWRPFLSTGKETASIAIPSVVVPVLPFPASFGPAVACIRGLSDSDVPPSDIVAPALLGALLKSVHALLRFRPAYREEKWCPFEAPWWERRGPYLVARCEKRRYSVVFRRLLDKGVFISPTFPGPSIVPADYTPGELKPLKTLARQWTDGRWEGKVDHD
jgi:hypothetical protein